MMRQVAKSSTAAAYGATLASQRARTASRTARCSSDRVNKGKASVMRPILLASNHRSAPGLANPCHLMANRFSLASMDTFDTDRPAAPLLLDCGEGRIAYDVTGEGPLVACLPGMGELRSSYRHNVAALTDAGFRVATMDLRGHGDSDATF